MFDVARARNLIVGALVATVALTLAPPAVAPAAAESYVVTEPRRVNKVLLTGYEAQLVRLVNRERRKHDLRRLRVTPCAEDFSRRWTKVMARKDRMYHNPKLVNLWNDRHCDQANWIAENVGYAFNPSDARDVFKAYMDSPPHRANILHKDARFIGIGSHFTSDGTVWNTMNFTNGGSKDYGKAKVRGQGLRRR